MMPTFLMLGYHQIGQRYIIRHKSYNCFQIVNNEKIYLEIVIDVGKITRSTEFINPYYKTITYSINTQKHIQYISRRHQQMEKSEDDPYTLLTDKQQLIQSITKLLMDLLSQTKSLPRQPSPFDCKQIPKISILDYFKRIAKHSDCSNSVLVATLIYIDRFQERIQNFIINYYNIHRLLISCAMMGAKYFDDFYYKNEFYAKIGGISKIQMNNLELQILQNFEFNLHIQEDEFISYMTRIQTYRDVNS